MGWVKLGSVGLCYSWLGWWVSYRCPVGVVWVSFGCYVCVIWVLCGCRAGVVWESFGCHVGPPLRLWEVR